MFTERPPIQYVPKLNSLPSQSSPPTTLRISAGGNIILFRQLLSPRYSFLMILSPHLVPISNLSDPVLPSKYIQDQTISHYPYCYYLCVSAEPPNRSVSGLPGIPRSIVNTETKVTLSNVSQIVSLLCSKTGRDPFCHHFTQI